MPVKDILLALLVPSLWGFGFVIAKPAMDQLPPILLNGLRWSLTGFLMFWFVPFPKRLIKQIIIISIVGCTIQYSLTYTGLNLLDAASATFLIQTEVPFGIIVAYFLLGEKTHIKNIIGIIIAFIGVIILSGSPSLEGKMIGVLILLSGTFVWAIAQVLAKPISKQIGGIALTAWLGVFAGPLTIVSSYFIEGNTINYILNADYSAWLTVIYLGIMMNIVAYSIWYHVLSKHPVNYVLPVLLLFPVTGLITAIFLLGENPTISSYIGGLIIIFGVAIILINKKSKN
tara:strand:+ start:965 stop:1822 length:858 start_codon:yes stop_codon:yes gene_type:complete